MSIFEIDSNIRKARTLDSAFYTEERYFKSSLERIFARTWQFVGHADEVTSLKPVTLLPGSLDEPLLLVNNGETH